MARVFFLIFLIIPVICIGQHAIHVYTGGQLNIQPGGNVTVKGGTSLAKGSVVINNGTIRIANTHNSYWKDSNSTAGSLTGTGTTFFEGTAPLAFYGGSNFYDVVINCNNLNIDSSSGFTILNQLLLRQGIIRTGLGVVTILSPFPGSIIADPINLDYSISYINGNLSRSILTNVSTYDFPVGDSAHSHYLKFLNNGLNGVSNLLAWFGPKNGPDVGLIAVEGGSYTSVHNKGVWYLSPDASPTSGNFSLQLSLNAFTGLVDNQFGILSRPSNSSIGADWIVPAGSILPLPGSPGRTVSSGFSQRNLISGFNHTQFGLGTMTGSLPVTLVLFNGKRIDQTSVKLEWQTVNETNNSGFFIERRANNAGSYRTVGWVPSKAPSGTSLSQLNYKFIDSANSFVSSIYRLKQLDIDGRFTYSNLVAIKGSSENIRVFPTLSDGRLQIDVLNGRSYFYIIADATGKTVKLGYLHPSSSVLSLADLPNGYYLVIILNDKKESVTTEKIMLHKK